MDGLTNVLIIAVPLLGGIALLFVCARAIFSNPNLSNSHAWVLGVGALLCVAPTLASLTLKGPGFELSALQKKIDNQGQEIKNDIGEQGATIKGAVADLTRRLDQLEKSIATSGLGSRTPATGATAGAPPEKRGTVVVVLYDLPRKELALRMQDHLLQKGYSANAVFTDFSEVPAELRGQPGSISLVYTAARERTAEEVKKELRAAFRDVATVTDQVRPKLSSDVQVRLF